MIFHQFNIGPACLRTLDPPLGFYIYPLLWIIKFKIVQHWRYNLVKIMPDFAVSLIILV